MRYTFPKAEHLCLQRHIDALFSPESQSIVAFPLRVLVRPVAYAGKGPKVQVLISVSKRKFKHAVDRNRAKRQVREAYRLNKHLLLEALPPECALHLAFVWISPEAQDSRLVHKRMITLLQRLAERPYVLPS
ncbi:MAG: ribonuclease P protein component [Bacteroidales bacterium]|nr:ribonuclease P protein component [Bacteroidales bacterium]